MLDGIGVRSRECLAEGTVNSSLSVEGHSEGVRIDSDRALSGTSLDRRSSDGCSLRTSSLDEVRSLESCSLQIDGLNADGGSGTLAGSSKLSSLRSLNELPSGMIRGVVIRDPVLEGAVMEGTGLDGTAIEGTTTEDPVTEDATAEGAGMGVATMMGVAMGDAEMEDTEMGRAGMYGTITLRSSSSGILLHNSAVTNSVSTSDLHSAAVTNSVSTSDLHTSAVTQSVAASDLHTSAVTKSDSDGILGSEWYDVAEGDGPAVA